MKRRILHLIGVASICLFFVSCSDDDDSKSSSTNMIIDHNCIDLSKIPSDAIEKAKKNLHVAFNNSWWHGSEIYYGMRELVGFKGSLYQIDDNPENGELHVDYRNAFGDIGNLEYHNDSSWYFATKETLVADTSIDVVIWCWENGLNEATSAKVDAYLSLMTKLETDYPKVKFVYMTGHLNGTTKVDNVYLRNEQIRKYCKEKNKILFDFADIESYDPDGKYYGDKLADDACNYDSDNDGKVDKNWAEDWQKAHTENTYWYDCGPEQTQPVNSNMKAFATWWMLARIAGWEGPK
jgi:hypothetical protein